MIAQRSSNSTMKSNLALLFLVTVGWVQLATIFDSSLDTQWQNFKNVFQKRYLRQEENVRRLAWEKNVHEIIRHNLEYDVGLHTYRIGLNEYTDIEHNEFVRTMIGYRQYLKAINASSTFIPPYNLVLPASVDWRKQGMVTGIKNQGICGSSWAFSTTGSLEGQHKKKTGKLVSLSEQNLIDCSGPEGNYGCEGGFMDQGFQYVIKNGGIDTEESYPYKAGDGTCHYKASESGATCTGIVSIPSGEEAALQKAVASVGPISVSIDASQLSFQLYSGGIYDEPHCSSEQVDYAALVVGYGTENGQDYWLVKNSWGTSWGEEGYIKMSRNKNNQCGIATLAIYPLV